MPVDRLLNTVLQHYQDVHDAAKTDQIIGTTVHLLAHLSNPLNLTVLTSQLLTAPAIWRRHDGSRTALRIISLFNTAAMRVRDRTRTTTTTTIATTTTTMSCDAWTRAVVKGADERSKRWQHLLVLAGVLMGMEGNNRRALSQSLRDTLEQAVVMAANLALEGGDADDGGPVAALSIVMALSFVLPLLSTHHKARINCAALLPFATWAMTGEEGFCDAQFLRAVARDTTVQQGRVHSWPAQSPSCLLLREMEKQPLVANMGPLSQLAAFAVQHAADAAAVALAHEALLVFTGRVLDVWHRNPFSEIDPSLESSSLTLDTLQNAWPLLWQIFRRLMFGTTAVLQAIVARSLLDSQMQRHGMAPAIASKSLQILRNIFFISNRNGNSAFEVYTFAYMASLDVLSRDALVSEAFLREARPADAHPAPSDHLAKTLDLFYLNVAEHLSLVLPTESCEALIVKPAVAYLSQQEPMSPSMTEVFESAHSAILSVLSCPQHSTLTVKLTPFYIVKLFESFPRHISPRQFRVAFRTVMEVVSPPFPIAAMDPELSETLLEMLRANIATASTQLLQAAADAPSQASEELLSEQSALVMTLIDSLPFLPLSLVEESLGNTARAINGIEDPRLRAAVQKRFWHVLVDGEMDVERSTIGVAWWGTKGGRELVLFGGAREPLVMSGALDGDAASSRL